MRFDSKGQVGNIEVLVGVSITLVILIALYSIIPLIGAQLDTASDVQACVNASGDFTFTGNTSDGEQLWLNYSGTTECYESDPLDDGVSSGCTDVDTSSGGNTSALSAYNFASSIDANTAHSIDASNSSDTLTIDSTLCSDPSADGSDHNAFAVNDYMANLSANTTLSGGEDPSDWNSDANSDIESGHGLWGSIGPLITLAAIVAVLSVVIMVIMQLRAR